MKISFNIFSQIKRRKIGFLIVLYSLISFQCNLDLPQEVENEMVSLPEKVDFNYHVKPILSDRCYSCHGPDEKSRKAGLRLDIESVAFSKLESNNRAFVKGNISGSESVHRILSNDPEKHMPPPESNLSLSNLSLIHI